jgi:hypothetical protein
MRKLKREANLSDAFILKLRESEVKSAYKYDRSATRASSRSHHFVRGRECWRIWESKTFL